MENSDSERVDKGFCSAFRKFYHFAFFPNQRCCVFSVRRTVKIQCRHTSTKNMILFLSQDIDLSYTNFRQWLGRKVIREDIKKQIFNPERYEKLGANLSAATFMVTRGGAVKIMGQEHWYKQDRKGRHFLPRKKTPDLVVEGIDSTDVQLFYEGLENLGDLDHLKYFKVGNNPQADDFFLSKLVVTCPTLEFLDISDCSNVTEKGLACLHHLENLKCLRLSNVPKVKNLELVIILLEEMMPHCTILLGKEADRINAVLSTETSEDNDQLSDEISDRINTISEASAQLVKDKR